MYNLGHMVSETGSFSKKYIFADMDGTLAESKTRVLKPMVDFLKDRKLVVISGAKREQMKYQLQDLDCELMAQCGNECSLWQHELSSEAERDIIEHVNRLRTYFGHQEVSDLIYYDNRGCQVNYSVIGSNNHQELKLSFDPDFSKRIQALKVVPFESDLVEIRIAGTTGFDYTIKGRNKGSNISDYINHKGWDRRECIYFGDALFPGGNDEAVVGVIDTVSVLDPEDTLEKMKGIFTNQNEL